MQETSVDEEILASFDRGWSMHEIALQAKMPIDSVVSSIRRLRPQIFSTIVFVPNPFRRTEGVFTPGREYTAWKSPRGTVHCVLDDRDHERIVSPRVETVFSWN